MFSVLFLSRFIKMLFPKGKAFSVLPDGNLDKLYTGISREQNRFLADATGLYDTIFPDNGNFTEEDAENWERKLGIIPRIGVSLDDRKRAIELKFNHPFSPAPRQHYLFIQEQLRMAGFDVYVYENRFGPGGEAISPEQVLAPIGSTQHASDTYHSSSTQHRGLNIVGAFHNTLVQHGQIRHGGRFSNIIANSLEREKDAQFVFANKYRSTFFIAGANFPDFAEIPRAREIEFRQLLLQLKPVQTVGLLFVNYY